MPVFFILCPSLYLGPCFYSAGCYPAFSYVHSPALNAGFLRFVRGSLAPRCFFVLFSAVFRGFPFFFSPASDAGVLPPLWRGRVFPFTVQSRDHLATITDIYVPSFSYVHSPALNAGFPFVKFASRQPRVLFLSFSLSPPFPPLPTPPSNPIIPLVRD